MLFDAFVAVFVKEISGLNSSICFNNSITVFCFSESLCKNAQKHNDFKWNNYTKMR